MAQEVMVLCPECIFVGLHGKSINKHDRITLFKKYVLIHFHFMCMGVLPACMSVQYTCSEPAEARRGQHLFWYWS